MPWKGVTVSEQRQRFLEDFKLNYYSITDLAERFGISRRTAHKWVNRFEKHGQESLHELSRGAEADCRGVSPQRPSSLTGVREGV